MNNIKSYFMNTTYLGKRLEFGNLEQIRELRALEEAEERKEKASRQVPRSISYREMVSAQCPWCYGDGEPSGVERTSANSLCEDLGDGILVCRWCQNRVAL